MAGGPIFPASVDYGSSGDLFRYLYLGAGGNAAPNDWTHGVAASIASDRTLGLRFFIPPSLPSGTLKLRIVALANDTSHVAKLTVSDGIATPATSPGSSGNPGAATLTAESQTTVTWAASENDRYKEAKVTLTSAPVAGDVLVVAVKFQTTGWTLNVISGWIFSLIWE